MDDLPAEVRCMIYSYYLDAFPDFLTWPCQPPLARVKKDFRKEILPMFYAECGFTLHLTGRRGRMQFFDETWGFLQSLVVNNRLGLVRSLRFCIFSVQRANGTIDKFCIDVRGSEAGYDVSVHDLETAQILIPQQWRTDLEAGFKAVFAEIKSREEKEKLRLEDIYRLRRGIEQVVLA